jgi:SET domain-containing protein
MNKNKLLKHLQNDIYCRLGISKIAGIGVFAIKTIPKGVNPFKILAKDNDKIIELNYDDVKDLDKNVKKIINDFFGQGGKLKKYDVLASGPNNMNISYYLNHSDKPNLDIVEIEGSDYLGFITNQIIKEGDELTIDYSKYE